MAKKPKNESIHDILDRIEDDISAIRDKVDELENQDFDSDDMDDDDDDSSGE
jgi:hypothetical protein